MRVVVFRGGGAGVRVRGRRRRGIRVRCVGGGDVCVEEVWFEE